MVMLSAVDSPPGPSVAIMHGPGGTIHGCCTWPGGTNCGETIGSVIVYQTMVKKSSKQLFFYPVNAITLFYNT